MTARLRTHAAAALLLLPLGLATLAAPASAQPGGTAVAQAQAPLIERFVLRPQGRLHAGEEVRFRLSGVPGGRAWVDVPGVFSGLTLAETRSGVYEGRYVIRSGDNLDAFSRAVATLQAGPQRATAQVEQRGQNREGRRDERQARDERPPQVVDVAPAQGARLTERGRTRIAARLDDQGRSGVDPASVQLRLDGRDVTRAARITENEVEYREDLAPGRHTAEVILRDRAGNVGRRSWTFDVVDEDRRARPHVPARPVAIPLQITSHRDHAVLDMRQPFEIQGRTVPHAVVRVSARAMLQQGLRVTETVRADARGYFVARVNRLATGELHNMPVEVIVYSILPDGRTEQQRLSLVHQE